MNKQEYMMGELRALQRRLGANAERERLASGVTGALVATERERNDETDAALVELGELAAGNAVTNEEIMAALVELAGLLAGEVANGG